MVQIVEGDAAEFLSCIADHQVSVLFLDADRFAGQSLTGEDSSPVIFEDAVGTDTAKNRARRVNNRRQHDRSRTRTGFPACEGRLIPHRFVRTQRVVDGVPPGLGQP